MSSLLGKTLNSTYSSLLKLEGDTQTLLAGGGTAIQIKTGDDESTPVYLNTNRVGIGLSSPAEVLDVTGNIKASGTGVFGGALTCATSLTIGSAAMVEADLEKLDGITNGTAVANKALVLDANKDIGTIRNLTIDGTFSDGNYTFDTSGNVTGLGNVTTTGDLIVGGGDITGATDADLSIHSDGNISFILDDDNDETGQKFYFYNDTVEIATLNESGDLQIDGDITISGNDITFGNTAKLSDGNGYITFQEPGGSSNFGLFIKTQDAGTDSYISFMEASTIKWNLGNDGSDSDKFKISSNAASALHTDTELSLDTSGNLIVTGTLGCGAITSSGNLGVTGTITGDTSLTLDSTTITTAEIGVLDAVTPGTAAASKALVLDSGKDINGIRNMTITGAFTDSNYTFDSSGNVSGLGTVGCGVITQSGATLAATYSPIAGHASIVTTGALDTGSITSGFTSIDVGAGAIAAGSFDASDGNITNVGDIDADSISVADAAAGLSIDFSGGATATSDITIADNLAEALVIQEGSTDYLKIVTTNSSESIAIAGISGTAISIGHATSETTVNDNLNVTGALVGTRLAVTNLAGDGSIPITATCVNIDANGGARTGIRFAGTGTAGQMIVVNNTGGETLQFHATEGTALVRGIHVDHDFMSPNGVYLFISDGSLWNYIGGGVDTQPDLGLATS
jgi:hypothetical protein